MPTESIVLQLQTLALSKAGDPTELLRKTLLVASKLQLNDFRDWVAKELNGYDDLDVPDYRKVRCELRLKNPYHGLIPIVFEDERASEALCNIPLQAPVSAIHELLRKDSEGGALTIPFSPAQEKALLKMQNPIAPLPPVRIIGRAQLAHILDAIYNTVLAWALKLEQEGIRGDGLSFTEAEKEKAATSTEINIHNFQGVFGNVTESTISQNLSMSIGIADLPALKEHLLTAGVTQAEISQLETAIHDDPKPASKEQLGPQTTAWLGKVMLRLAASARGIASGTAGSLIAEAIWKYLGF